MWRNIVVLWLYIVIVGRCKMITIAAMPYLFLSPMQHRCASYIILYHHLLISSYIIRCTPYIIRCTHYIILYHHSYIIFFHHLISSGVLLISSMACNICILNFLFWPSFKALMSGSIDRRNSRSGSSSLSSRMHFISSSSTREALVFFFATWNCCSTSSLRVPEQSG